MVSLDHIPLQSELRSEPLMLPWPAEKTPLAFLTFATPDEWRGFIESFNLNPAIPLIVSRKYERAQKLYYLGWVDFDLIKAGELIALTALELALKDRYGNMSLASLLRHMVEKDGLTNEKIPLIRKSGGNAISRLLGDAKPSIAEIRNSLAHGDPFDGLPQAGLIELVRDLIEYAYRNMIRELQPVGANA